MKHIKLLCLSALTAAAAIVSPAVSAETREIEKRVLFELYTGMWCGNCPRGHAAAENLQKQYPERAIVIMYHFNDELQMLNPAKFPVDCKGMAPRSTLDRGRFIDPYFGSAGSGYGILTDMKKALKVTSPIGIEVKAEWDNSRSNTICATAELFSESEIPAGTKVEFVLTAGGLYDESWYQHNYLSGTSSLYQIEEVNRFNTGPQVMVIEHDDVCMISSLALGNSPVAEINGKEASASYEFNLLNARSRINSGNATQRFLAIEFPENLSVIALVTDKDGKVLNCHRVRLDKGLNVSVGSVADDAACNAIGGKGEISLYGSTEFCVADLSGRICAEGSLSGSKTLSLPAGVYAVRIGSKSFKTIVR